ncbi:2-phosphosulfolactate phosphatase [Microbacterium sp. P02]|uniref:2-phosphosulfolactate phosphatase n=1 Tax=Microbacterium sp. P02 TaxID=3366260 RepID=UPI003671A13A
MSERPPQTAIAFDQHAYQVRFEWGVDGLRRLAASDVIVVVDVLRFSTSVTDAAARGASVALSDARATSINGAAVAAAAAERGGPSALVLAGCLRNASAVARAILDEQVRRGARTSVAVVAAGELVSREPSAPVRFAIEDQLGAGAIIDALAVRGIDHSSPEAAIAGESFRALRRAARHLVSASGSGRELAAAGHGEDVSRAAQVDADTAVAVLRAGVFEPLV